MKRKKASKKKPEIVRAGFGTDRIHIGQTEEEVRRIFGKPDHLIRRFQKEQGVYFYEYLKEGFDLNFGKKGGRVRDINFFRRGVGGHRQANIITEDGLRLGDTRRRVLRVRGQPDWAHEGYESVLGYYVGASMTYDDGLFFEFDQNNRIREITVSRPKTRRRIQPEK